MSAIVRSYEWSTQTTAFRRTAERRNKRVWWPLLSTEIRAKRAPFRLIAPLDEKRTAYLAKKLTFATPGPTSPFELTKYRQTLDLLPPIPFDNALECACSEGVFTSQLAERVTHLLGADISPTALRRAKNRCREQKNVRFVQLDLTRDALPGRFDLIVCSEVLYFIGGRRGLERVACKLASSLVDRGYLLMAHLNLLKESPKESGFVWNLAYGAKTIGEVFQETYPLRLIREMQFPLYRLHLFQRQPVRAYVFGSASPEITGIPTQPTELSPELAAHVRWNVAST